MNDPFDTSDGKKFFESLLPRLFNFPDLNQIPPRCHPREGGDPVAVSNAGIFEIILLAGENTWIPAFAGMTREERGLTHN